MSSLLFTESNERERKKQQARWPWKWDTDVAEEANGQLFIAVPMILSNVAYYGITLISVMAAGRLGEDELAGAALGNSWATVTGLALMTGLSGSLETLCGQAFGAKEYKLLGVYMQSSILISMFFSVMVSILWYHSETILILLHQDAQASELASIYLRCLIPGLFSYGFLQCVLRFLQTQTVVVPLVVYSLIPLVLHVGLTHLFVHVLGFGFKGAPMAATVSLWVSFLMLALYIKFSTNFALTWEGLSLEAFSHVIPSMKLALPSALMVCLEFWAFELLVLLAGLMPNSERSTSVISMCVNTEDITYMMTYGFSAAISTRVSNEIGAGNIKKAKIAIAVSLKLSAFLGVAEVVLLASGHDIWARFFSSSPQIIRDFGHMTPFLTVSILIDSALGVLTGVARGCGWQNLVAWINLACFYLIGMLLSLLLGFGLGLGAKGMWTGLSCGLFCQACALLFITLRTKMTKLEMYVDVERQEIRQQGTLVEGKYHLIQEF